MIGRYNLYEEDAFRSSGLSKKIKLYSSVGDYATYLQVNCTSCGKAYTLFSDIIIDGFSLRISLVCSSGYSERATELIIDRYMHLVPNDRYVGVPDGVVHG